MQKLKEKIKGITLMALVVTIIVLLILAGVSVNLIVGNKGIFRIAEDTKERHQKESATELLNIKILDCQMLSYEEKGTLPTLAYLASYLENDKLTTGEIEYVQSKSNKTAALDEEPYVDWDMIYTKFTKYPYEFEINSSFQIAINNEPVETTIPTGYMKIPTEELDITKNGEYDVINKAKVNVNVPEDEYLNKPYIRDNLVEEQNRITITDGGYYTDTNGTTYVNITFRANQDLNGNDSFTIIKGLPNVTEYITVTDVDRKHAFYVSPEYRSFCI